MKKLIEQNNNEILISIQEAAMLLGVSSKTLRRWEEKGILIPLRTAGNQRRYSKKEVLSFEKPNLYKKKEHVSQLDTMKEELEKAVAEEALQINNEELTSKNYEGNSNFEIRNTKSQIPTLSHKNMSLGIATACVVVCIGLVLFVGPFKLLGASDGKEGLSGLVSELQNTTASVLAAATGPGSKISFNIPAIFKQDSIFQENILVDQNATISANLLVGGSTNLEGATTIGSTLGVAGATTLSSTLTLGTGNTTFYSGTGVPDNTIGVNGDYFFRTDGTAGSTSVYYKVSGAWTPTGGITSLSAGTGISVSGSTGAITISNTGVTSLTAGTDISVSGSSGSVTVSDASTLATVTGRGATTTTALTLSGAITMGSTLTTVGNVGIGTTNLTNEALELAGRALLQQVTAPTTTTNKLYNVSGNLFFNGVNLTAGGALPSGTTGQTLYNSSGSWTATSNLYNDGSNVGIGTTSPVAKLHNQGSTLYGTLAVSDKATGGALGTAAATVDIYTSTNLTQTTSGQTITLPTPSNATAGRLFYIANTGTTSFLFLGSSVQAGTTTAAVWDGDSWNLAGGGGLTPGTVANSTLRWNDSTSQWVENTSILSQANPTADLSKALSVSNSGAVTGTGYTGYFTKTGASTTNIAGYFSASGGTSNYAGIFEAGNVGIGSTAPGTTLDVTGTGRFSSTLTANTFASSGVTITGGTINSTTIGASTPSTGAFTTLTSSGNSTIGTGASGTHTFGAGAGSANTIGNSTGTLALVSGGTSAWTNTAGNLTIQTATSGNLVLDSVAALNIGNTAATSLSLGRTGVTTTNNGALTSTETLTASNGFTMTTGALSLTSTSGSFSVAMTTTNKATFSSSTANSDTIQLLPQSTTATNTFNGIITSSDLTVADKTWTFPNASGTVAVSATSPIGLSVAGDISCSTCVVSGGSLWTAGATSGTTTQAVSQGGTLTFTAGTDITTTGGAGTITFANTSTLATVTGRGATTTTLVNLDGGIAVDTSNFTVSGTTGAVVSNSTGQFASTLTASNGFTQTTGALSLTATSGSIALTGFGTTAITSTTTTGNIFTLADSSLAVAAAATGNLANLTFTNTSTNTSGTSIVTGLNIAGTNTASGTSGTMETYGIRIQDLAGTAVDGTQNNYGLRIGNYGQSGGETSYGLYVDTQSGSTTANYAAIFAGGNVGIGTTAPANTLAVISTTTPQLRIGYDNTTNYFTTAVSSAGAVTFDTNGAGAAFSFSDGVTANTFASSGATITGGSINNTTVGASTPSTGAFTTLTSNNTTTIGNGSGIVTSLGNSGGAAAINLTTGTGSQTFTSSVVSGTTTTSAFVFAPSAITTGTGIYASSSTLTSGLLVDLQVSGTAAAASQTALNILTTGANATTGITTYGAQISNTHTNATSGTNIALYLNASGATTANYGLIVNAGNVGVGLTTPAAQLDVLAVAASTGLNLAGTAPASVAGNGTSAGTNTMLVVGTAGGASSGTTGQTGGTGGALSLTSGVGGAVAGASGIGGVGGGLTLAGGAGGNGATTGGTGGAISITAGAAGTGGNANGGTLTLNSGAITGSGTSTLNLGTSNSTVINIGDSTVTKTIDIGGVTSSDASTISIATEGTAADILAIGNTNASTTLALTGGDDWSMAATGILTMSASASQTTAIVITDTDYTNSLSIGDNTITGTTANIDLTNFDVVGSTGAVTIAGSAEGTASLTQTAGDHVITDGDLTISGGEISATSDDATGTNFSFTTGALTTGTGLGITASAVMTSGSALSVSSATYVHTALNDIGNLVSLSFTDASTNANNGGTTNGINIASTINTSGAGTKSISAINIASPTKTACTTGACTWTGLSIADPGTLANTTFYAATFAGGNVGIGDTTPDYLLDVAGTLGVDGNTQLGDSNTTDTLTGTLLSSTFTSGATTQTAFQITGTAFTTGELLDLTGTFAPADGSTNEAIDLNITHTPTVSADNFQSINLTTTDGTALANTIYNQSNTLTLTGDAAKTGYGIYSTVTSNSTTADSLYGGYFATSATGNVTRANNFGIYVAAASTSTTADKVYGIYSGPTKTGDTQSGTQSVYGIQLSPSATGPSTSTTAITNVYGAYVNLTATHAADAGTVNAYGLYVANGTSSTNGTSTKTGLYVEAPTGADTNYAAIFAGGNVGIGTTAPANILDIYKNANATTYQLGLNNVDTTSSALATVGIRFDVADTLGTEVNAATIDVGKEQTWTSTASTRDGYMAFATTLDGFGSEKVRINSAGNVGIGATAPLGTLQVGSQLGDITGAPWSFPVMIIKTPLTLGGTTANLALIDPTTQAINVGGGIGFGGAYTDSAANFAEWAYVKSGKTNSTTGDYSSYLAFGTRLTGSNTAERMRIDNNGNVGIGTTNPSTIYGAGGSSFGTKTMIYGAAGTGVASPLLQLTDSTAYSSGADRNAGIFFGGLDSASAVQATASILGVSNFTASSAGTGYLAFRTKSSTANIDGTAERMRIDSNGNVGIGNSSPQYKFDVLGESSISEGSSINSAYSVVHLDRLTPDTTGYMYTKILSARDTAGSYKSYLAFFTESKGSGTTDTSTEKMRIDSAGNIKLATDLTGTVNMARYFTDAHQAANTGVQTFGLFQGPSFAGMSIDQTWDGTYNHDDVQFYTHKGGVFNGIAGYFYRDGSFVVGTPTGGAKGFGTINATSIYRNGTALDTVFEPGYSMLSIPEMRAYYEEHLYLPTIPTGDVNNEGSTNMGALTDRLWETTEVHARYIAELDERLRVTEGFATTTGAAYKINADGDLEVPSLKVKNSSDAYVNVGTLLSDLDTRSATTSAVLGTTTEALVLQGDALQTQIDELDSLLTTNDQRLTTLESLTETLASQSALLQTLIGSSSASFVELDELSVENATISGELNVLGRATFGDVGITGDLNVGLLTIDGLSSQCHPEQSEGSLDSSSSTQNDNTCATINTLSGDLRLQSLGLGGVDFLNGKVTIDTNGNVVVKESLTAKKIIVDTTSSDDKTLGSATIPSGQTEVTVNTTTVSNKSKIFITATSSTQKTLVVSGKQTGSSFTVSVNSAPSSDLNFDWFIVEEKTD